MKLTSLCKQNLIKLDENSRGFWPAIWWCTGGWCGSKVRWCVSSGYLNSGRCSEWIYGIRFHLMSTKKVIESSSASYLSRCSLAEDCRNGCAPRNDVVPCADRLGSCIIPRRMEPSTSQAPLILNRGGWLLVRTSSLNSRIDCSFSISMARSLHAGPAFDLVRSA